MEFETQSGEKGCGRIRDWGERGVQLVSDTGKVLHLFSHELKGREKKKDEK
jgi:hypothetical protein